MKSHAKALYEIRMNALRIITSLLLFRHSSTRNVNSFEPASTDTSKQENRTGFSQVSVVHDIWIRYEKWKITILERSMHVFDDTNINN